MSTTGWFLDDEPSTRFPVYCRGNVGEIVPHVATPLSATVTTEAFRLAFTDMFTETGAFSADELADPASTGGLFGGYLYFNLSFARSFAARAPGMRVADVDQQMFGSAGDAPPYRRGPGDRSPRVMARAAIGLPRMMLGRKAPDLDAGRAEVKEWIASIPNEPTDAEVAALAAGFPERAAPLLRALLESSFGAAIPGALVERIAARAIKGEPGLLVKAMSGLGTIETAAPAQAMWRLGRLVAASAELTAMFDDGVDGLLERLRASSDTAAAEFLASFDDFLAQHGHRGPNEVELASDTWATNPASALAFVERLRFTAEAADPEVASERLAAERSEARDRLVRATLPPLRPLLRRLLDTGSRGTAKREQAKGTLVLAISGLRTPLFRLAERLVAARELPDRTQFFMATVDELPALLADPASMAAELADRRARYEELNALIPPFAFEGRIPDPATWPRRADAAVTVDRDSWTGIGVSSGVASGRARIITDPSDPRGIEPGEILVAPLTDPAWTPLFLAAAAVVVDVGALQSHAAIVARELGVPAVVSVEGASQQIRDGDLLHVDGDRGVVTRAR
jgi:rifampicin phosphotransferase